MFENIISKINAANTVGIFTHINPDGDALGSSYSLKEVLKNMGKCAEVFWCGGAEKSVMECTKAEISCEEDFSGFDLLLSVDSADISRLGKFGEGFLKHNNTAAIDHHITHASYAKETIVVDTASCCEIMYKLYIEMGVKITLEIATKLYVGIVTDTGNFKYAGVTGETHRVAADLIEKGVNFSGISKKLFDTVGREYLELKKRAINSLKFYADGKIAILNLKNSDFEEAGIDEIDASGIVTLPCSIEGVEVGVYVRRRKEGECKVSLRSVSYVDVSEIACGFGGGGHIRAAGYSVSPDKAEENIQKLIAEIEKELTNERNN